LSNVNFNSWSTFTGDGGGFFAIIGGLYKYNHAYKDIIRTGEFIVNFLGQKYYDSCVRTFKNEYDSNEFELGGFTEEKVKIAELQYLML
jgi:flavin reductase (DIM6/NTAB) family NADH-FMN oxidoreductase RutF